MDSKKVAKELFIGKISRVSKWTNFMMLTTVGVLSALQVPVTRVNYKVIYCVFFVNSFIDR